MSNKKLTKTINTKIYATKAEDADIRKWFESIESLGQSRSLWCAALLTAFSKNEHIDTGNPNISPALNRQVKNAAVFDVSITKEAAKDIATKLKENNSSISNIIKYQIRRGKSDTNIKTCFEKAVLFVLEAEINFTKSSNTEASSSEKISTKKELEQPTPKKEKNPLLFFN